MLPVDGKGKINWDYMKEEMKEQFLKSKKVIKYQFNDDITDFRALEEVEVGAFQIEDIFY